jgi:anti-sigma B factor antagonist
LKSRWQKPIAISGKFHNNQSVKLFGYCGDFLIERKDRNVYAMDEIKLSLSQVGPSGELSIIRVDGVVDTITASELENVIERLLGQDRYKIIVDLGGVEYISSAGWGIFVSKIQEIRDHKGDIKLVNMIPNVYEIYELLEFEHIIQAFDSTEQGKKAFNLPISGDGGGEKVWKTDEKIISESGSTLQSAFSPGTKAKSQSIGPRTALDISRLSGEELILRLIIEDPFSSISELAEQAEEVAPTQELGWWKIFGILRQNRLLRHRSRFRYARRQSRR